MSVASSQVTFVNPGRTTLNAPTTVVLFTPNALFGPRFNQLDVALNKTWHLNWARVRTAIDVYNALNSNSVQNVNTAYNLARAEQEDHPCALEQRRPAEQPTAVGY